MRILHVVESFGAGTGQVVRTLAARLAANGHEVGIAYGIRPETPASPRGEVDDQVDLFAIPWKRRTVAAQVAAIRSLRRLVRSWDPDLIHLHSSFAGLAGALAVPRGTPTVYSPHAYSFVSASGKAPLRPAYLAAERFVARRTTLIGAVSHTEASLAREVVGAKDVEVVVNGIPELDEMPRESRGRQHPERVVAMGRIGRQHQPEASARILGGVSDLAELVWIGDGKPGSSGVRALQGAGVRVTGWLPRKEALAWLTSAAALLHWTAWDAQSMSVLEAMAFDVPVVASAIAPSRELLGGTGICSSEDEAIARLRALLTNPSERQPILAAQRTRRANHGANRMARDWEALYRRILSAPPVPRE